MSTLYDRVTPGDKVTGKTTNRVYEVDTIYRTAGEREDAIVLMNDRREFLPYTREQFNHHFKR